MSLRRDRMGWYGPDVAQERDQWRVPGSIKCWKVLEWLRDRRFSSTQLVSKNYVLF
jgi:hypothetical protein